MILDNEFQEADELSAYTVSRTLENMKKYIEENAVAGPKGDNGEKGETGKIALVYNGIRTTESVPSYDGGFSISINPSLPFNRMPELNDRLTIKMKGTGSLEGRVWLLNGFILGMTETIVSFSYSNPVEISGPQGDKGDKGEKGDKGDTGATGGIYPSYTNHITTITTEDITSGQYYSAGYINKVTFTPNSAITITNFTDKKYLIQLIQSSPTGSIVFEVFSTMTAISGASVIMTNSNKLINVGGLLTNYLIQFHFTSATNTLDKIE